MKQAEQDLPTPTGAVQVQPGICQPAEAEQAEQDMRATDLQTCKVLPAPLNKETPKPAGTMQPHSLDSMEDLAANIVTAPAKKDFGGIISSKVAVDELEKPHTLLTGPPALAQVPT